MREPDPLPVDLVHAEVPNLVAAVVLLFACAVLALWLIILSTPVPA